MMQLFAKVVKLAQKMDLVSLGRVAIDGSRFKVNTSQYRKMNYEKLQRAVGHIEAELEVLKKDLEETSNREVTGLENNLPKEMQKREVRLGRIKRAIEEIEYEHKDKVRSKFQDKPRDTDQKSLNDP
jgi:hypothetical protein